MAKKFLNWLICESLKAKFDASYPTGLWRPLGPVSSVTKCPRSEQHVREEI